MRGKTFSTVALGAVLVLGGACGGSGDDDDDAAPGGSGGPTAGSTAGGGGTAHPAGGSSGSTSTGGGTGGTGTGGATAGMSGGGSGTGSGGAAGTNDVPPGPTDCKDRGGDPKGMCAPSASGVYAIKTVVDVWWQDDASPPLIDPGRDTITVYLMGKMSGVCSDGKGVGLMKGCGTVLPPFKSDANCDVFAIEFPDEIWDSEKMPTFETTGMTNSFEPGGVLDIATATGLVGIDLMDPDGAWPTSAETGTFPCKAGKGTQCFPDHDGDGKPGITIRMGKIGEVYSKMNCGGFMLDFVYRGAPLDAIQALDDDSVRADKLQIGVRTRIGGGGAIGADCESGVGDSTAEHLDSRVLDCSKTDGSKCDAMEATFVDEQAPTYNILKKGAAPPTSVTVPATQGGGPLDQKPSVGPRSALVRLGDLGESFTCGDVRKAAFPAL